MANLHRILGRGAICWRIVDPWPGPVAQGLLSVVVVVVVGGGGGGGGVGVVMGTVSVVVMQCILLRGYMKGGFLNRMSFNSDLCRSFSA